MRKPGRLLDSPTVGLGQVWTAPGDRDTPSCVPLCLSGLVFPQTALEPAEASDLRLGWPQWGRHLPGGLCPDVMPQLLAPPWVLWRGLA